MRCASCMAPVRGLVLGGGDWKLFWFGETDQLPLPGKVAAVPLGLLCSWRTGTESPLRFVCESLSWEGFPMWSFLQGQCTTFITLIVWWTCARIPEMAYSFTVLQFCFMLISLILILPNMFLHAQVMVCQSMLDHCARRSLLKVNGETARLRPVKPVRNG